MYHCLAQCFVLLALAAWHVESPALDREQSAKYFEEALSHFEGADYRGAIIQLKNALKHNPDNLPARVLLGRAYLRVGDGASAELELIRAETGGTHPKLTAAPLAKAYFLQGKLRELLTNIHALGHTTERRVEILVVRGYAHFRLNELDEARATFEEAKTLRPDSVAPLLGLARVEFERGRTDEAAAIVEQALAVEPDNPESWHLKGEIQRFDRHPQAAIRSFDRAITLVPSYVAARLGRAISLIELGRYDTALLDTEYLREAAPNDPHAAYLQALIFRHDGKIEEARQALLTANTILSNQGPEFFDEHPSSLLLSGVVGFALRQYEEAFRNLVQFVQRNPQHPGARKLIAAIWLRWQQPTRAIETLQQALELTPDDPQLLALVGNAYVRGGHFADATAAFEKATGLSPDDTTLLRQFAASRLAMGQPDAAIANLETARKLDPEATSSGIVLGYLYLTRGEFELALQIATELAQREPDNLAAQTLLGAAQFGAGDKTAAFATFDKVLSINPSYLPAHVVLGKIELSEGKLEAAKVRYEGILEQNPESTRTIRELARIAEAQSKLDEAIRWLEKISLDEAGGLDDRLNLVDLYLRTEQPDSALAAAQNLANTKPDNLRVLSALGRSELAVGRHDLARVTFRRMSKLAGYSTEQLHQIARHALAAEDLEGARWSLQKALQNNPDFQPARVTLIELEISSGRLERAHELVDELQSAHPDYYLGDMLNGDALMKALRYSEAAQAYIEAIAKHDAFALTLRLYRARRKAGQREHSLRALEKWIDRHPEDRMARRVRAAAYLEVGELEAAKALHEELQREHPDDAPVLNNLAWIYEITGNSKALEYAERAYELAPDDPTILDTLGWIHVRRGDPTLALTYLREARSRLARAPRVAYHIAVALNDLGRRDAARRELQKALQSEEEFEGVREARALLNALSDG